MNPEIFPIRAAALPILKRSSALTQRICEVVRPSTWHRASMCQCCSFMARRDWRADFKHAKRMRSALEENNNRSSGCRSAAKGRGIRRRNTPRGLRAYPSVFRQAPGYFGTEYEGGCRSVRRARDRAGRNLCATIAAMPEANRRTRLGAITGGTPRWCARWPHWAWGARFRLPLLVSFFKFAPLEAVILNKATSLIVVISALIFRANSIPFDAVLARFGRDGHPGRQPYRCMVPERHGRHLCEASRCTN